MEKFPGRNKGRGPNGPYGPGAGMGMPPEKAKEFQKTFRKLAAYPSQYHMAIIAVVIFTSTLLSFLAQSTWKRTTETSNGLMDKINGGSELILQK